MIRRATEAETEQKMRALLAQSDDFRLFTEGGCAVFWKALRSEFGYGCAWIPGYDNFRVSHVFAPVPGDLSQGIDALGTVPVDRLLSRIGGTQAITLSPEDLEEMAADPLRGIFAKEWFTVPAMERAKRHIVHYRQFFDGSDRREISR